MMTDDSQDRAISATLLQVPPEDDGFSARVLARLPRRRGWRRPLMVAAAAVAGALPAFAQPIWPAALPAPELIAAALVLAALTAMAWLATESGFAPRGHS